MRARPANVAVVVAPLIVLWMGVATHQWFVEDEWAFIVRRDRPGLAHPGAFFKMLLAPHNEHWLTIPVIMFRAVFGVVGLKAYWPYLAMLMACHALGIAANKLLHNERVVCLWLVPTNTIREQTLTALRDRKHPYRQALASRFAGPVTVLDLTEALYVQAGTMAGETCVIVSTLAALRVEETEGRKVYETNGALQHHFTGLTAEQDAVLERNDDGTRACSLANVLRLHAPIVIMDEAHNARTPLSFDTLARFRPSCIIEFTATPETTHDPAKFWWSRAKARIGGAMTTRRKSERSANCGRAAAMANASSSYPMARIGRPSRRRFADEDSTCICLPCYS